MSNDEFAAFIKKMRSYRDKFIAHLDKEKTMHIPNNLHIAHQSAAYLYDYMRDHEDEGDFFIDAPDTALSFYMCFLNEGKLEYREN
jgi:hypothetical protein